MNRPMTPCRISSAVVLLTVLASRSLGQAPAITGIFPAGAQAGATVTLQVTGKPGENLRVWSDCDGVTLDQQDDKIQLHVANHATLGPCLLRFYNSHGATKLFPFVVGASAELTETEPNNRVAEANRMESAIVANGVLSRGGDVDVFALRVRSGETLVADICASRLGSPMDPVLQLLDETGNVLAQNDDSHGTDSQIVFEAPRDATLLARVFAFPATPNSSIGFAGGPDFVYRLTLTRGPFLDHAMPLLVNEVSPDLIRLVGWPRDHELQTQVLAVHTDTVRLTAPGAANTIDAAIVSHPCVIEDAAPTSLTPPFSITGTISQAGEVDQFKLRCQKGPLQLSVRAQGVFSPLDPLLQVFDSSGKLLREVDDISRSERDIATVLAIPKDGDYIIRVTDRFGHGGPRFLYAVTCESPEPKYRASVSADAFTHTAGGETAVQVTIERLNGFSAPVQVTARDLPEGLTCDPVTSPGKGAMATSVKLVIKGRTSASMSGPFQIQSAAQGQSSRSVRAAVPGVRGSTNTLWLTVSGS